MVDIEQLPHLQMHPVRHSLQYLESRRIVVRAIIPSKLPLAAGGNRRGCGSRHRMIAQQPVAGPGGPPHWRGW
jgi:hypothetical protein